MSIYKKEGVHFVCGSSSTFSIQPLKTNGAMSRRQECQPANTRNEGYHGVDTPTAIRGWCPCLLLSM
jgi:hypothetical protein